MSFSIAEGRYYEDKKRLKAVITSRLGPQGLYIKAARWLPSSSREALHPGRDAVKSFVEIQIKI